VSVSADFPAADFASYLAYRRTAADHTLARVRDEISTSAPPLLAEPLCYALEAPGKRLRSILCRAAHEAVGGRNLPGLDDVACSIELIHTYSLVHDDLPCMDDDALRRGRPTVHRVFGEARAILAGAALIPLAFGLLDRGAARMGHAAAVRGALARELARGAGASGMVGGQLMDLDAEGRNVPLELLEGIHARKTAALLIAALKLGAVAAGAAPPALTALERYGAALGLAFQITDDVLDVTAPAELRGKTAGRDQALGKATFPGLLGLAGAVERAEVEATGAVRALAGAGLDTPALRALARYAVEREH
jgi:geranylgeranyl diphosphate synthase type II